MATIKNKNFLLGKVKPVDAPNFRMNPVELYQYLPRGEKFVIKRVYWISESKAEKKSGQHAHTDEDEIFICIKGKVTLLLDSDGKGIKKIPLEQNNIVWVPRYTWHGYEDLSDDCIILALSSTNYDPERKGYINDYPEFQKLKAK
jgi:quercetin dioxygenase-like cupin family protein